MEEIEVEKFKGREISILMGGWSSERAISIKTGEAVNSSMRELGLNAKALDLTSKSQAYEALDGLDLVFVALHGRGGEDGFIQKILEEREMSSSNT